MTPSSDGHIDQQGGRPPDRQHPSGEPAWAAQLAACAVTGHSGPFVSIGDWPQGVWHNEPRWVTEGGDLLMTAEPGSDFWRLTGYGFVRDSGHALLTPLPVGSAVEVDMTARTRALFDQAGIMIRRSQLNWVKAGIEHVDGAPHLGAVVTDHHSDWSSHPVPEWEDERVTIRVSRASDSVTVRARGDGGHWQLVRLSPMTGDAFLLAGPYCCAPSGPGYTARFHRFAVTDADASLHEEEEPS